MSTVSAFHIPSGQSLLNSARRTLAKSDGTKEDTAFESRRTHWLNYAQHNGLLDRHATNDPQVIDYLLTTFVEGNLQGYSLRSRHSDYKSKHHVATGTIKIYLNSINRYYEEALKLRKIWHPEDNSVASRLLKEWKQYETLARRRMRIPDKVFAEMERRSTMSGTHGFEMAMYRWALMGSRGGFRQQEYAQDIRTGPCKYYYLPGGRRVLRAFAVNDFRLYQEGRIELPGLPSDRSKVEKIGTHFGVQKNLQCGQIVLHGRNEEFPQYCCVNIAMDLIDTATALGQGPEDPLAVYLDARGQVCHVTGDDMTTYLRYVTAAVYPAMSKDQLQLISSHSLRVTACVLLHEAGKDGSYIKLRLRWLSDCFFIYLRDSDIIVAQHDKALSPFYDRLREFALEAGLMDPADDVTAPVLGNFTVDDDEDICLAPAA